MSSKVKLFSMAAADIMPAQLEKTEVAVERFNEVVHELVEFINSSVSEAGASFEVAVDDLYVNEEFDSCEQTLSLNFSDDRCLIIELSANLAAVFQEIVDLERSGQVAKVADIVDQHMLAGPFFQNVFSRDSAQPGFLFPRLRADEDGNRICREDYELSDEADRQDFLTGLGRAIAYYKTFGLKSVSQPKLA